MYLFCAGSVKPLWLGCKKSHPGDFKYRSNWRNSFHEMSVPSTETESNLKAPYQENKVDDLKYFSQSPLIFAMC